ncbi:multifunctional CCA addition/repair protein [Thalassotalea sp. LPB0316]|uniref:multifunctional CCA addition/repair protein n=1 Tax=Thalassotalea sp. LPB0316 TaxID=2769490 RepID=UPI001868CE14|nr:multifunctional CCA addition/repair protein [Thalassotalea sp. LPB0316]QOL25841.1 multifunctional CCA addition/repair protein [Thalassotalea sp. LPB0316]
MEAILNTYLVGGAVRDELLGRKVIERDYVVVGATTQQMLELGFSPVGKDFPVFLHPQTKEEYALARTEKKQGVGYQGFVCYASPDVSLEDDLKRRDLTVNAMAKSSSGDIIDPFNGQQDLENRVLRHVSDAFVEDPLRVLRVARFAARYFDYGFSVARETMALMAEIVNRGELEHLSAERVFKEFDRSLAEDHPEVFIQVLKDCGALKAIWPSLNKLWGIPNPAKWHPEICSGIHTMMVLQRAVALCAKPAVRFAALCHDLGKGLTDEAKWPSHHGHESAGLPLVKEICQKLKVPKSYELLALQVCQFHLHCHKAFELNPKTILKMFNSLDVWRKPENFDDFLIANKADFQGRTGFEDRDYPQADYLKACFDACQKITAKPFVEQGLKGKEIKDAMNAEKIRVLTQLKAQQKN